MMCNYYESNAETFSVDMSKQYQRFLPLLKNGVKILDVGSGSGRDVYYFQKQGYQATALEPSKNLCREIRKVFQERLYVPISRTIGRRNGTMGSGRVRH